MKEGLIGRHLTFVSLGGIQVGPDSLQVLVTKEQAGFAPDIGSCPLGVDILAGTEGRKPRLHEIRRALYEAV